MQAVFSKVDTFQVNRRPDIFYSKLIIYFLWHSEIDLDEALKSQECPIADKRIATAKVEDMLGHLL